jgi:hypothetical protein
LTIEDLRTFSIWEFAIDEEGVEGQDETWVRPVGRKQIPMGAYSQLVAADFTTAGGQPLQGFMVISTDDGLEITPGAVLGQGFYHGLPSMSEERAREEGHSLELLSRKQVVEALGGSAASLFPMIYKLRATIHGEKAPRSGVVK